MLRRIKNPVQMSQSFLITCLCQKPCQYKVCCDAENIFPKCQGFWFGIGSCMFSHRQQFQSQKRKRTCRSQSCETQQGPKQLELAFKLHLVDALLLKLMFLIRIV